MDGRWQLVAIVAVVVVGCGDGKRRLTNGKLDVYASIPSSARIEPVTETDASGDHSFLVRVHLDTQVHVDVAHYPRPCDLAGYQAHQEPSSGSDTTYIKLLGADKRPDGYAVRLETNAVECPTGAPPTCWTGPHIPVLAIETCSTTTQTVCHAKMPLGDSVHVRAVASLCDSLRAVD